MSALHSCLLIAPFLMALSACAAGTPPAIETVKSIGRLPASFQELAAPGACKLEQRFYQIDDNLIYVRRNSSICSDSGGGALYDRTPARLLCISGGISGTVRCNEEHARELFLRLETQRNLDMPLEGHRVLPLQP